ncbi:MAG: CcdB family protein [Thermodesulfobacteriota bacterium]
MAQFDVHRNGNPHTCRDIPYLLDVQSDLLDPLATRVVVPLVRLAAVPTPVRHLNPVFEVQGKRVVLSTPELAGIPRSALGEKVENLAQRRDEIIRALDVLFTGL